MTSRKHLTLSKRRKDNILKKELIQSKVEALPRIREVMEEKMEKKYGK